jgi:AMP-binding enzyme
MEGKIRCYLRVASRPPWLTQGYLKDPKGSEKLWAGGWLHTGDVATIDTDGYVKITDRLKDMIRRPGGDCAHRTHPIAFAASRPCACGPLDSPRTPRRPLKSSLCASTAAGFVSRRQQPRQQRRLPAHRKRGLSRGALQSPRSQPRSKMRFKLADSCTA